MDAPTTPAIVPAALGPVLRAFGEEVVVELSGEQTGGKLAVWTEITPPGGGPPPHYHLLDDEWFHIEEGRVAFFHDGQWSELGPGGAVFMPRNVVHAFTNVGDTPSRMRISTSPAGFEKFFARCAEEFAKPGPPDMPRIIEISAEHGIHFVKE
jgi:quercetin dioxygenase-like cupin family protein